MEDLAEASGKIRGGQVDTGVARKVGTEVPPTARVSEEPSFCGHSGHNFGILGVEPLLRHRT